MASFVVSSFGFSVLEDHRNPTSQNSGSVTSEQIPVCPILRCDTYSLIETTDRLPCTVLGRCSVLQCPAVAFRDFQIPVVQACLVGKSAVFSKPVYK